MSDTLLTPDEIEKIKQDLLAMDPLPRPAISALVMLLKGQTYVYHYDKGEAGDEHYMLVGGEGTGSFSDLPASTRAHAVHAGQAISAAKEYATDLHCAWELMERKDSTGNLNAAYFYRAADEVACSIAIDWLYRHGIDLRSREIVVLPL